MLSPRHRCGAPRVPARSLADVLSYLDHQADSTGTILASFTYDTTGTLTSVVLGNPNSGPRYYYAYDAQGNVVAVTDSSGTVVANYSYDAFGNLTSSSESFPNGWSNPFRYDGAQGVRYDTETGLYWMSVRAYDPTLGRFLSHDPLGRLAALGLDFQPYVYVGNNPVNYTDPSGMMILGENGERMLLTRSGPIMLSGSSDKCNKKHPCKRGGGGSGVPSNPCGSAPMCATGPSGSGYLFGLDAWSTLQLTGVGQMGVQKLIEELERLRSEIDGKLQRLAQAEAAAEQQANEERLCVIFCTVGAIAGGVAGFFGCGVAGMWVCVPGVALGGAAGGDWLAGKLAGSVDLETTPASAIQSIIDGGINATLMTLQGLNKTVSMTSLIQVDEHDTPLIFPIFFPGVGFYQWNPDGLKLVNLSVSVKSLP